MSRLLGPPVTAAPPKQEKKVLEKIYAFDSNDSYNEITIIVRKSKIKKKIFKKL